jgi:hypothetical protein
MSLLLAACMGGPVRNGIDFAVLDAGQVDLSFGTGGTNGGDRQTGFCLHNDFFIFI